MIRSFEVRGRDGSEKSGDVVGCVEGFAAGNARGELQAADAQVRGHGVNPSRSGSCSNSKVLSHLTVFMSICYRGTYNANPVVYTLGINAKEA